MPDVELHPTPAVLEENVPGFWAYRDTRTLSVTSGTITPLFYAERDSVVDLVKVRYSAVGGSGSTLEITTLPDATATDDDNGATVDLTVAGNVNDWVTALPFQSGANEGKSIKVRAGETLIAVLSGTSGSLANLSIFVRVSDNYPHGL